MPARVWTKPQTQQTLTALRRAGYKVTKDGYGGLGYKVMTGDGPDDIEVLRALPGSNGYLINYKEGLFGG
jgi:hypothetical protein